MIDEKHIIDFLVVYQCCIAILNFQRWRKMSLNLPLSPDIYELELIYRERIHKHLHDNLGITKAFAKIAESGAAGFSVVSGAISEALVATAAGLAVAIPAMAAYNLLTNSIDRIRAKAERSINNK